MKYLKKFESIKIKSYDIKFVIDILEDEYGFLFKTIPDDIRHQFWVFQYSNRPIALKLVESNIKLWSSSKNYIMIYFLDLDIDDEIYKSLKFGRSDVRNGDGIFIQLSDREVEDVAKDVYMSVEGLKGLIDENNL